MIKEGLSQLSLTDADCRLMKNKNGMDTAYNVQTAVDTETHMMPDYNMTNANTDHGQLAPTMEYLKEQHPGEVIDVIADKGYHRDGDYVECLEKGTIPNVIPDDGKDAYDLEIDYVESECDPASKDAGEGIIPDAYKDSIEDIEVVEVRRKPEEAKKKPDPQDPTRPVDAMRKRAKEGYFVKDPEAGCVYCPSGATLYKKSIKKNGDTRYCNRKLCKQCPYKDKCVTSAKYPWKEVDFSKDSLEKKAKWWEGSSHGPDDNRPKPEGTARDKKAKKKEPKFHYEKKKKVRFKLRPNREKMDKRKCTSEHPFGTIKRWHDSGYFLLKGMQKVDGEFALLGIGYNLSRAENMYTFDELMERVGRKTA